MIEDDNVSPTCEVVLERTDPPTFCGQPTRYWYKAQLDTMALCVHHAVRHLAYAHEYHPSVSPTLER